MFNVAVLNSARGEDVARDIAETRYDAWLMLAAMGEKACDHMVRANGWEWRDAKIATDKAFASCVDNLPRRQGSETWSRVGESHIVIWVRHD